MTIGFDLPIWQIGSVQKKISTLVNAGQLRVEIPFNPSGTPSDSDISLLTTSDSSTSIIYQHLTKQISVTQAGTTRILPNTVDWIPGAICKVFIEGGNGIVTRGWIITGGVAQYLGSGAAQGNNVSLAYITSGYSTIYYASGYPSWAFGASVVAAVTAGGGVPKFWLSASNGVRTTSNIGYVGYWNDQIGQIASSAQDGQATINVADPAYSGASTMQFHGGVTTDDFQYSGFPALAQPFMVFIDGEGNANPTDDSCFYDCSGGARSLFRASAPNANTFQMYSGTFLPSSGGVTVPVNAQVTNLHSTTSYTQVNGGAKTSGSAFTNGMNGTAIIGGGTGGPAQGLKGKIADILFCTGALSDAAATAIRTALASQDTACTAYNIVVCDGNSLTYGNGSSVVWKAYPATFNMFSTKHAKTTNTGVPGRTTPTQTADLPTNVFPLYDVGAANNIYIGWEGTNDLYINQPGAIAAYNHLITLAQTVKANNPSWKVILGTILPRQTAGTYAGFEADRLLVNSMLMSSAMDTGYVDAVANVGADPRLQDPSNLIYYNSDKTNLTDAGYLITARYFAAAVASTISGIL